MMLAAYMQLGRIAVKLVRGVFPSNPHFLEWDFSLSSFLASLPHCTSVPGKTKRVYSCGEIGIRVHPQGRVHVSHIRTCV